VILVIFFSNYRERFNNCVNVIGHYRKRVKAVNLSIPIMQTLVDNCRNSFVAQPNRANAGTIKYPLKLRKPYPFKIRFYLFVMGGLSLSNVKEPLTLPLPLLDDVLR